MRLEQRAWGVEFLVFWNISKIGTFIIHSPYSNYG